MRPVLFLAPFLAALGGIGCGAADSFTAPPPSELALTMVVNPDPVGGLRSNSVVSAMFFENELLARAVLEAAEFAVFDAQGGVLIEEALAGPVSFGADRTMSIRQVLEWTPADVVGRRLRIRFRFTGPTGTPTVIENTSTF